MRSYNVWYKTSKGVRSIKVEAPTLERAKLAAVLRPGFIAIMFAMAA